MDITKTKPETIRFGAIKLEVLDQKDLQVPKTAYEIEFPAEDKKALAVAIEKDLPTLLIGETGTGKTSVIRYLAFLRKQGYTRINMHGYNTPDELIGSKSVKDGSTYYENGILTNAMQKGHIVVLDEINATPPDCMFILHGLLDDDKQISLPNGDVIKPHKDFRFFATMNPDYEGTRSLNRAFLDRFNIILNIDILDPKKEKELLIKRLNLEEKLVDDMIKVAWLDRKAYKEQKTLTLISTRSLLQWGGLVKEGMNVKTAFITSVANKARQEEQTAFIDFYNAVMKSEGQEENLDAPFITTVKEMKQLKQEVLDYQQTVIKKDNEIAETAKVVQEMTDKYKLLEDKIKKFKIDQLSVKAGEKAIKENELLKKKIAKIQEAFGSEISIKDVSSSTDDGEIKVGDTVEAGTGPYTRTKKGWQGKVIKAEGNTIRVVALDGSGDKDGYPVDKKHFSKI